MKVTKHFVWFCFQWCLSEGLCLQRSGWLCLGNKKSSCNVLGVFQELQYYSHNPPISPMNWALLCPRSQTRKLMLQASVQVQSATNWWGQNVSPDCLNLGGSASRRVNAQCPHECDHLHLHIPIYIIHFKVIKIPGWSPQAAFSAQLCHSFAAWLWRSDFTSLGLCFLACKMIGPTS